jgi:predicted dehydrogenase
MNTDPVNVRNIKSAGGGALMDIGCYGISAARFITGREPARVSAVWDIDPRFATDRLVTATLDFGRAYATFTCATQMARYQRVDICGTDGTIEIEVPFNPPIDRRCTIVVRRSDRVEPIVLERANQFEEEIRAFACAITGGAALPIPLADSVANMEAIDAVRASAECGEWVDVERC